MLYISRQNLLKYTTVNFVNTRSICFVLLNDVCNLMNVGKIIGRNDKKILGFVFEFTPSADWRYQNKSIN